MSPVRIAVAVSCYLGVNMVNHDSVKERPLYKSQIDRKKKRKGATDKQPSRQFRL